MKDIVAPETVEECSELLYSPLEPAMDHRPV